MLDVAFDSVAWRIAHAVYLVWLVAGLADFWYHRRSHLPENSGLRESRMHLLQIGLLGAGAMSWLVLEPTWMLWRLCALLTTAHAVIGYLDTRAAYGRRPITPIEQHLRSILDIAPWAALTLLAWYVALHAASDQAFRLRVDPLSPYAWQAVLLPALILVVLPALLEFVACLKQRRSDTR